MKLLQVANEKVNNSTAFHLFSSYRNFMLFSIFSNLFFYVHSSIWIFSSHFEMNAVILFPKHSRLQCFLFLVDAISSLLVKPMLCFSY
ncbi:hypothetical protein BDA99DRAFT_74969 [Phascolomyces articulosus]|uniref:Uncharacterized protein n=1 Tax=Phascolomyces articulosus TaxID=60185 RepID=A0AAD5PDT5_9FUNG|nr:hypothetical protein BDA99DRAFT_74969 [Phascolomyces articulosus]